MKVFANKILKKRFQNDIMNLKPLSKEELKETILSDGFFWNFNRPLNLNTKSTEKSIIPSGIFINHIKKATRTLLSAILYKKKNLLKLITNRDVYDFLEKQIDFIQYHNLFFHTSNFYKIGFDVVNDEYIIFCGMNPNDFEHINKDDYKVKIINKFSSKFTIYFHKDFNEEEKCLVYAKILYKFGEIQINEVFANSESLIHPDYDQENYIELMMGVGDVFIDNILKGFSSDSNDIILSRRAFDIKSNYNSITISDFNFIKFKKNQIF